MALRGRSEVFGKLVWKVEMSKTSMLPAGAANATEFTSCSEGANPDEPHEGRGGAERSVGARACLSVGRGVLVSWSERVLVSWSGATAFVLGPFSLL
jgi:hypothetical protein